MPSHPYNKHYFHGGTEVGGYAGSGYRDFPVHWTTYARVMERAPQSVLELGCGRGYLLKRFAEYGNIPVQGLEISEHCRLTRAIDNVCLHDVTRAPWPVADHVFDLCLSVAVLEHIPEARLPVLFAEMARTTRRGLHGIDIHAGEAFDQIRATTKPLDWWAERLPPGHEVVDKKTLEVGTLALPPGIDQGLKLNLGSFTHMFHGWRNLDCLDLSEWARENAYSFTRWNLSSGIYYDDQVVDLIFLSHVLEHFDYAAGKTLLRECRRVLKPNGVLRVAVPDADKLIELYHTRQLSALQEICGALAETEIQLLHELLYGGEHRAIYNQHALVQILKDVGFARVERMGFGASTSAVMQHETIDLYPEMSLFVEASS
jgi:predicted SAM-dependent methyltransferase